MLILFCKSGNKISAILSHILSVCKKKKEEKKKKSFVASVISEITYFLLGFKANINT